MHPTSTSTTTTASNSNNSQYFHPPPVSTLRRASRPSNIDLSIFDSNHHHHHQQTNDPAIYSAPIYYVKQLNLPQQTHIQQTSQPYTASFQYQPQQQLHIPSQNPNLTLYHHPQQQPQPQPQPLIDPYSQNQHTPHTFPLQGSPNHYHQYFYFPPSNLQQVDTSATTNHQSNRPQNDRLRAVQQQQWSNPVLSPLMVKRINENAAASISLDDDEDPSASIDALVADVDSSPQDLLDEQQNKSLNEQKQSSTQSTRTISPSSHLYLRGTSHILTTPPNPLASNDHPDNQLTVNKTNFQKTFSPIASAGFELPNTKSNVQLSSTNTNTSYFTFETNQTTHEDTNDDNLTKPLIINTDIRLTTTTTGRLSSDENSNQNSTTNLFHQRTSSPLLNEMKSSPIDLNLNSTQPKHFCTHPDCNKVFANKSALAKHKLTHSQDRKHKCPKCNKGFKRLDHLHGHMLTHEEEKPHKCRVPTCNRTYCDARSLKRHIENVHQEILASIYDGTHKEYRQYLPETAIVKTKDLTINNDFSVDSIDSNSPHSLSENESSFNIRTTTGTKILTTYTYDEEKCVECHICKKPFKNGAALNGHMRLHGGFNEKQSSPSSTSNDSIQKKKSSTNKRKRTELPMVIKTEEQDISMISSLNDFYPSQTNIQQYSDSHLSVRSHSVSSTIPSRTYSQLHIQNPLSVQPTSKYQSLGNSSILVEDKFRKTLSSDNCHSNGQINGYPSRTNSYLPNFSLPSNTTGSLQTNLLQQIFRQKYGIINQDSYFSNSTIEDSINYAQSPRFTHSPIANSNTSTANTPVPSPYTSHASPVSNPQNGNINTNNIITPNSMEPSPATQSTSSSCSSSSSSSNTAPKKRFLNAVKQESGDDKIVISIDDEPTINPPPFTLQIIPDIDSPTKKSLSGFLIGTPSSTGTSSSSSTSSQTHFHYDDIIPEKKRESTPSSFQWPSQFRRQLSLNMSNQTSVLPPSTPYTPPPMLSPFRKGPGLYYRVFSQPGGTTSETPSIPTTPIVDESANPKINIGHDYQAFIPKLRTDLYSNENETKQDELLFSPSDLPELDEKALEKFEQLNRMNPYLFSPRHSPASYSMELVYMLLYEYNGNLQRTLAALLEGTAKDIKQCRPIHHYRFSECDAWTPMEIEAYTKAIRNSEKNFEVVSRAVGTKTIKQCIEFHYMPKVNLTSRKIFPMSTSSVITRRKRFQLDRAKQYMDDEASSSPLNESRLDDDSDSTLSAQYTCDIDDCSRIFTSERACRAHRKEHRRTGTVKRK